MRALHSLAAFVVLLVLLPALALGGGFRTVTRSSGSSSSAASLTSDGDVIGFWKLNEASGTAASDSGPSAYGLTCQAGATVTTGQVSNARSLTDDWCQNTTPISAGQLAELQGEWTLEAWVNLTSMATTHILFSVSASGETEAANIQLKVHILSSGRLEAIWETGAGTDVISQQTTGLSLGTGVWTHVAITKTSAGGGLYDVRFFVNGQSQQVITGKTNTSGGTSAFVTVGGNEGAALFTGKVDEVYVVGRAKSASEIAADYATGTGSTCVPQ